MKEYQLEGKEVLRRNVQIFTVHHWLSGVNDADRMEILRR